MEDKIQQCREVLHRELEAKTLDGEKVLKLSQELDELIVEFYKGQAGLSLDFEGL